MGLFTKKTEEEKAFTREKLAMFWGESLQVIGKIPAGKNVCLSLKPSDQILNIQYDKTNITLPYNRLRGFRVENEVTLAKSGSGLGGAIVGGALFGVGGAIVGQNMKKGKTKVKWIATLSYVDKEGDDQTISFIQNSGLGYYDGDKKHFGASQFENLINDIVSRYGEDITEL